MKTVILDVRAPADSMADFVRVWKTGKAEKAARISFATPELLWQVLTAKRWELLKALCGAGPMSIRGAARRGGRDVKAPTRSAMARSMRDPGAMTPILTLSPGTRWVLVCGFLVRPGRSL